MAMVRVAFVRVANGITTNGMAIGMATNGMTIGMAIGITTNGTFVDTG